jgi:excisionase family DNA binding protein
MTAGKGTDPRPASPLVAALLDELRAAEEAVRREIASYLLPELSDEPGRLLDAEEKARQLGLNRETLVRMAREGRVSGARKIGREWRFPRGECEIRQLETPLAPERTLRAPTRRPAPRRSVSAIRGR